LPDGKRLLTSGFDGAARQWDIATGRNADSYAVTVTLEKGRNTLLANWSSVCRRRSESVDSDLKSALTAPFRGLDAQSVTP
jgi:hypothetical protein